MRINQNKKNIKLKIIIISTISVLLLGGAVFAWFSPLVPFFGNKPQVIRSENTVDYNRPTQEQKNAGEEQKKSTAEQNTDTKSTSQDTNLNNSGDLIVSITSSNQTDNQLQIRSLIGAVSSNGTCTLILTKDSLKVTKQSDIQAGPSSSTCKGFDVPTSELSRGIWQVTISVVIGNQNGSASKAVTIQ
jgi:hypothetical protein